MESEPAKASSGNRGFRIFFRAFLSLCILICVLIVFGARSSPMERLGAGAVGLAGVFMFVAVGRPPTGWLYGLGIALFCLMLGGFGAAICVGNESCVPNDDAVQMIAAAITLACSFVVRNAFSSRSPARHIARGAAISSAGALVYFSNTYPALGGALMFLFLGFIAVVKPPAGEGMQDGVEVHGDIYLSIAGVAALYAFAYYARDWMGMPLILTFATAWLVSVLYEAWKKRR